MTEPRIPLPGREELDEAQRQVWDKVVSGPRGQVIGPLRAAIHNAELAGRWSALGESLRFSTSLPKRLSELAICVTGRRWSAQVEWFVHARTAAENGIAAEVLEAMREGRPPVFDQADERLVYEFARTLQQEGQVPDAIYGAAVAAFGVKGVVELTALVGYYTMVSMTLNAHGIPLPEGEVPPLVPPAQGLFTLPAPA
ncbi:carboxymuconolactone decarboxylase family protein [Falsiroseomonas selenitidurans]|uniref:Carboxymuconolactone decarboxylase family protein n=1 Tax=Falsiroseomonas selenitidurans TaxID=2716335 RepID=A0ABX1E008_9PROT|nr:carboxymuconolactone decarboxylase family protein [Falsiroseomonas selenitidurans]NKC30482.1 carboxymuconolactone decarboxylase family protein [Falsiroseomonas selenitidurans]